MKKLIALSLASTTAFGFCSKLANSYQASTIITSFKDKLKKTENLSLNKDFDKTKKINNQFLLKII